MEPAAMTLLLLLLLQLLRSLMVVSLPIQPRLLTLDTANKPLPRHHRRMCLLIHLACVFAVGEKISYTWSAILYPKVFPLFASVTVPTASHPLTVRIITPSKQRMANNSQDTRLSRAATASRKDIHNKASSNKLHLHIPPRVLVPTASLHLASTASQADPPTTASQTITVSLVLCSYV